jgi:hypothetical protein
MRRFLMIAAVLIGLANAIFYSAALIDNNIDDVFDYWELDPWPLNALYALSAIVTGLLISGSLLRLASRDLQGSFFARYGLMVLAVCLGGVMLGVLLTAVTTLFDEQSMMPRRPSEIAYTVAFAAIPGGVLGIMEGLVLAFPLSAFLGVFRNRG